MKRYTDLERVLYDFDDFRKDSIYDPDTDEDEPMDSYIPDSVLNYFKEQEKLYDLNKSIDLRRMLEDFGSFRNATPDENSCDIPFDGYIPDTIVFYFDKLAEILRESEGI